MIEAEQETMEGSNVQITLLCHAVEHVKGKDHRCAVSQVVWESNVDHNEDYCGGECMFAVHIAVCC